MMIHSVERTDTRIIDPEQCPFEVMLAPSMIQEINCLVAMHHRLITPVGVIEGSRGLSEATPPDIVAGQIVDPEGITADAICDLLRDRKRRMRTRPGGCPSGQTPGYHLRSLQDQNQISANDCEAFIGSSMICFDGTIANNPSHVSSIDHSTQV